MRKVGIILSSQKIINELSIDFGDITPSELPLGNKYLYHHQKNFLESHCEDIYITLPDYKSNDNSFENVIFLKKGISLLSALKEVLLRFLNQRVFILFGDTLVFDEEIYLDDQNNYVFIHNNIEYNYEWSKTIGGQIIIGCFVFNSTTDLIKLIDQSNDFEEFIHFVTEVSILVNVYKWMDFGQKRTFSYNKIKFLETRGFNSITYKNGYIEKKSRDWFKMYAEYNWLKKVNEIEIGFFIPNVKEFNSDGENATYKIEYKDFISLSDKFTFGNFHIDEETRIIKNLLESRIKSSNYLMIDDFIAPKLKERYNEVSGVLKSLYKLEQVFEHTYNYFSQKEMIYGVFHGDFCYSNILYNNVDNVFYLIDPRGFLNKTNGFSYNGPLNYDLYKLAHSYVCGYDKVIAFNEIISKEYVQKRFEIFCQLANLEKEELKYGLIQLFLSMIPLHYNNAERQNCFAHLSRLIFDEV